MGGKQCLCVYMCHEEGPDRTAIIHGGNSSLTENTETMDAPFSSSSPEPGYGSPKAGALPKPC